MRRHPAAERQPRQHHRQSQCNKNNRRSYRRLRKTFRLRMRHLFKSPFTNPKILPAPPRLIHYSLFTIHSLPSTHYPLPTALPPYRPSANRAASLSGNPAARIAACAARTSYGTR